MRHAVHGQASCVPELVDLAILLVEERALLLHQDTAGSRVA